MLGQLLWQEVLFGNSCFLFNGVATDFDDLHSIEQGRLDGAQGIGRGDEEDLAQVIFHLQVIVVETVVLFRVKDFQEGGDGSPRKSFSTLSISSRTKQGLEALAFFTGG